MMSVALEQFVDRYFEQVLSLVDRLQADEFVDAAEVHQLLLGLLTKGRQSRHHHQQWEHAIYALAALTDELMLEMPWAGRTWWNDHVIEAELFGTRLCSERFYQLANEAAQVPQHGSNSGVLRVFHDCVLLGFRGVYSNPELAEVVTEDLGIPPTISQWLAEVQEQLSDDSSDRNRPASLYRQLTGAPPNTGRRQLIWWSIAAGTMLVANLTLYSLLVRS